MCSANVMAITLCNVKWPKGIAKGKVKMDRDHLGEGLNNDEQFPICSFIFENSIYTWKL